MSGVRFRRWVFLVAPMAACGGESGEAADRDAGGSAAGAAGTGGAGGQEGSGGSSSGATSFSDTLCSPEYCWASPARHGNNIIDVSASPTLAWGVGPGGTFMRRDSAGWAVQYVPGGPALNAVWAAADDDVWAVGMLGAVVHWDGRALQRRDLPQADDLLAVWGTGPDNVYAAGMNGALWRWDGAAWTPAPRETWVCDWCDPSLGPQMGSQWRDIWGSGPDDIWVIGDGLVHWDGEAWILGDRLPIGGMLDGIAGTAEGHVWAGVGTGIMGVTTEGGEWTVLGSLPDLFRDQGRSETAYATDLLIDDDNRLWVLGPQTIFRGTPLNWIEVDTVTFYGGRLMGLAQVPSTGEIVVGAENGVTGTADERRLTLERTELSRTIRDVMAWSGDEAFIIDPDLALWRSRDGAETRVALEHEALAFVPLEGEAALVVGRSGLDRPALTILTPEGPGAAMPVPDVPEGIGNYVGAGRRADDLWLFLDSLAFHWNGSQWAEVPLPGSARLTPVAATAMSTGEVVLLALAEDHDVIVRGDGTDWRIDDLPDGYFPRSVAEFDGVPYVGAVFLTEHTGPEGEILQETVPVLLRPGADGWDRIAIPGAETPRGRDLYHDMASEVHLAVGGDRLYAWILPKQPGVGPLLSYDGRTWSSHEIPASDVLGLRDTGDGRWLIAGDLRVYLSSGETAVLGVGLLRSR